MAPEPTPIPIETFDGTLKSKYTEVSTSAIGGQVLACSDDFFASRDNLIKPGPSVSMKGQFGPNGALYDGWESRRHNESSDWIIIKLGPGESHLDYVDIDTSHFSGNEAPQSAVLGVSGDVPLKADDPRWEELLPVVTLGPNSRHIFELNAKAKDGLWSGLLVRMIPDGGMARFRAYGRPAPPTLYKELPAPDTAPINLLSPLIGGHIVGCSDANFSPPFNLLLEGRGHDMSDGWETRRSQEGRGKYAPGQPLAGQERKEWVVGKLGAPGVIRYVEVDSAFHVGNYPVAVQVEATLSTDEVPADDAEWTIIVGKKPLGPHRQLWLATERTVPETQVFSHVRASIYPDGGLKRFRVFGFPIAPDAKLEEPKKITVTAMPLTYEAFAPYGQVIQGWSSDTSAPKGIPVIVANQGTAFKFNRLAKVEETYPEGVLKRGGVALACMRAGPQYDVRNGATIPVVKLERHAATTQAFIPMGTGQNAGTPRHAHGGAYVVLAAHNGENDEPDLSTLRAFLATGAQGVSYNPGVWHHPMLTVNEWMDYCCVDAQSGDEGLKIDCETLENDWFNVYIPPYEPPAVPSEPVAPAPSVASKFASFLTRGDGLIHPEPITHEAFAPFGEIVRAYPNKADAPAGVLHGGNPALNISKISWLSNLTESYPADANAVTSIGVYRATPKAGAERGKVLDVRYMERHPYTSQTFAPMGKAAWPGKSEDMLPPGGTFLVLVAEGGPDDRPDPATLKAFTMESGTALNYRQGTWHHPVIILDGTLDLACIETQIATGANGWSDKRDCELLEYTGEPFARVAVPEA
ncbi:Allantoicase [Vanrija albida]|uniref:Allantoicase n=1 Tax=Vanrija albida TaxID=181172 RepID=A0ABR3Q0Z3_9TREE